MGCCRKARNNSKHKNTITKVNKLDQIKKKKNSLTSNNKKRASVKTTDENVHQITSTESEHEIKPQNTIISSSVNNALKCNDVQQTRRSLDQHIEDTDASDDNSHANNIFSVETLQSFRASVEQRGKPTSIVFFYARYCPYSKVAASGLRKWAKTNEDRIDLYEIDVEQASNLTDYYHIQTVPTVMAFEQTNLIVPIWQRAATNIFSSDLPMSLCQPELNENNTTILDENIHYEEIFREKLTNLENICLIVDPTVQQSNGIYKLHERINIDEEEQYLVIFQNRSSPEKYAKLLIAITSKKDPTECHATIDQTVSAYNWTTISTECIQSFSSIDTNCQQNSSEEQKEYNGRKISAMTINTHFTGNPSIENALDHQRHITTNYPEHIRLSDADEIFYEKHYECTDDLNRTLSIDRFSTSTYQHVKALNQLMNYQREEICTLYLGPNRCRGFENNLPDDGDSSKLSLLTLKSHALSE